MTSIRYGTVRYVYSTYGTDAIRYGTVRTRPNNTERIILCLFARPILVIEMCMVFFNGFLWVLISFEFIHIYWLLLRVPIVLYLWIYPGIYIVVDVDICIVWVGQLFELGMALCSGSFLYLDISMEFDLILYQT